MSPLPNIDELLSGYLDGQLSAAERQQVEGILAESNEARQQLDQLRRNREALKASAVQSSTGTNSRLPLDFASRVILEAQRQAVEAGLPPTHHVRRGTSVPATPNVESDWRDSLRPLMGLAALAAVLILGWLVSKGLMTNNSNPGEIEVVQAEPEPKDGGSPFPVDAKPEDSSMATSEPKLKPLPDSMVFVSNGKNIEFEVDQFQVLLTLDLFPTQEAWEKNVIEGVLEDASISSSGLNVSASIAKAVDNTRSLKTAETEAGDAYIIFVGASDRTLDRLVTALQARNDIQSVMDMVMDRPREGLLGKLLQSIASDSPLLVPFAATSSKQTTTGGGVEMRRPTTGSPAKAEPLLQNPVELGSMLGDDEEALGFMLLIVHAPK